MNTNENSKAVPVDKEALKESQKETQKQYLEMQYKYIYYIGALSVASIGFAVQQTLEQPIKLSQIPLGIAIIFWGLSIFKGFKFLELMLKIHEIQFGYNHTAIKVGFITDEFNKLFEDMTKTPMSKAKNNHKYSFTLFILGCVLFILWRIIEMIIIYYNRLECYS
ncbi:MAG: hypothetical protein Q8K70_01805 [Bacteroidota bacterium]|nr:hypothetical protein [Bacteroidota bacterium]